MKEQKVYFVNRYSRLDNSYQGCRLLSKNLYGDFLKNKTSEQRILPIIIVHDHIAHDAGNAIEFMKKFASFALEQLLILYKENRVLHKKIEYLLKHSSGPAMKSDVEKNLFVLSFILSGKLSQEETNLHVDNIKQMIYFANLIESATSYLSLEHNLNALETDWWRNRQLKE